MHGSHLLKLGEGKRNGTNGTKLFTGERRREGEEREKSCVVIDGSILSFFTALSPLQLPLLFSLTLWKSRDSTKKEEYHFLFSRTMFNTKYGEIKYKFSSSLNLKLHINKKYFQDLTPSPPHISILYILHTGVKITYANVCVFTKR